MKPSALAPSMLKGKKHCFLQSLLPSNTAARKEEARGTKEINAVLEKAAKAFTKGHEDRCLSAVIALRLYFLWLLAGVAFSPHRRVVSFVAKPLWRSFTAAALRLMKSVQIAGPLPCLHQQVHSSGEQFSDMIRFRASGCVWSIRLFYRERVERPGGGGYSACY